MKNNEWPGDDRSSNANTLLSLARVDTLYGDLYRLRARFFLQHEMSHEDYRLMLRRQTTLANLPNQIRNAMGEGDWLRVRQASGEYKRLRDEFESKKPLLELARTLYDSQEIPLDPFSPGMNVLAGVSTPRFAEVRADALRRLEGICHSDREWQDFYRSRMTALKALATEGGTTAGFSAPSAGLLEEEAAAALDAGNFDKLERLAADLVKVSAGEPGSSSTPAEAGSDGFAPDDYSFTFLPETVRRAGILGLGLYSVPSRHQEFAPLCRLAWHPTYPQLQRHQDGVLQVPDLPLPAGMPDALKSRIQLFALHPFINSAGVRFLPTMVGEDLLVEDFVEPEPGPEMARSGLLEALGIGKRNELSRLQIEAVLQERGSNLVKNELGLDPTLFRVVCIPADLHLRIGLERGWGSQKIWTHFDGYMVMADGKLQALAGGDIRYGGIYDLLGISRNYVSDRVIARFAVVQRRRMATWQLR